MLINWKNQVYVLKRKKFDSRFGPMRSNWNINVIFLCYTLDDALHVMKLSVIMVLIQGKNFVEKMFLSLSSLPEVEWKTERKESKIVSSLGFVQKKRRRKSFICWNFQTWIVFHSFLGFKFNSWKNTETILIRGKLNLMVDSW